MSTRHLDAVAAATEHPVTVLSALTPPAAAGLTRATLEQTKRRRSAAKDVGDHRRQPGTETVELLAKVQDSELEPVEANAGELRALNRSARGGGLVARLEELGIDATRFAWAAAILGSDITVDLVAGFGHLDHDDAVRCAERLRSARILAGPRPPG
ncbi:tetratricopeptide repeat protein [Streptomyces hirsutus]